MDYNFEPILKRLKECKEKSGLTNAQLAEASGIAVGTLNKILSGDTTNPQLPAIMSMAKALHVSVDYLLYGVDHPAFLDNKKLPTLTDEQQKEYEEIVNLYLQASPELKAAARAVLESHGSRPSK